MELHHIKCFLAVAEEGSITGAASRLSIAQPHLSRQIKELEAELGAQLFNRGKGRACTLTDRGEIFLPYAQQIVDLVGKATAAVIQSQSKDPETCLMGKISYKEISDKLDALSDTLTAFIRANQSAGGNCHD